jgi:HlyD family secretion protein
MKKLIFVGLILAVTVVGGWAWLRRGNNGPEYRVAKVDRGDLWVFVTATGAVQPVTQVQVGTQVTGTIEKLNADFNTRVKAGQVIAQIDQAPFEARVAQDRANLARAEADVERARATLEQAVKELVRAKELARRELISESELDAAEAQQLSLAAQVKVALATVAQAKATLQSSEVNLGYTTIVSPVDGIVVSRNVDVGQTVAASLSAPTIFVIAASLKNMQIEASVSEADIGRIAEGQKVTFTVDAYRNRPFVGKVAQVRLSPTSVQNVVTYTVIVAVENPDEKLLPGMTANASFQVDFRAGALKVPNAALRFTPPEDAAAPEPPAEPRRGPGGARAVRNRVWVRSGPGLTAVPIQAGANDGSFTEVVKGDLSEGQEVVVGIVAKDGDAPVSNPFAPARPGGRR